LAKVSEEASERRFVRGLWFICSSLFGRGGLAGENELRDVGESDGVPAGDALARELPDEIAEEEIDLICGCETVDVGEKLGGEDLGIDSGDAGSETFGVVGTESRALRGVCRTMMFVDQHVTQLATGILVLALANGVLFGGHSLAFRKIEVTPYRSNEVKKDGNRNKITRRR
jgi:hypothetical protein